MEKKEEGIQIVKVGIHAPPNIVIKHKSLGHFNWG